MQQQKKLLVQLIYKIESNFVPGRPGTENFVPGFLQLSLSRDKGTPGQEIVFVPGRPAGRPVPWKA